MPPICTRKSKELHPLHTDQFCVTLLHPGKISMEPENHLFEEENHLPNLHFLGSMLIFRGANSLLPCPSLSTTAHCWLGISRHVEQPHSSCQTSPKKSSYNHQHEIKNSIYRAFSRSFYGTNCHLLVVNGSYSISTRVTVMPVIQGQIRSGNSPSETHIHLAVI